MKNFISNILKSNKTSLLGYLISFLIPHKGYLIKYKNILRVLYSINRRLVITKANPTNVRIAPINLCNYRCLFCEIHKDELLYPKRIQNNITMETVHNYEAFLSTAYNLSFFGGSEEPLLNSHFAHIVKYLKKKYGTKMMANTNASMLTETLSMALVNNCFDNLLVSYHAGTPENYKKLMTGDINKVNKNLEFLKKFKIKKRSKLPVVNFCYAIQKANANDYCYIINNSKKFGINNILINHYYGGRNKLQNDKVSFDYDIHAGNDVIDKIYAYAKLAGVKLIPKKPHYWNQIKQNVTIEAENFESKTICLEPWKSLHFNPVLDDKDCHYVGVCNRIELFKIRYNKFSLNKQSDFNRLWNHPILQYLRKSANSDSHINPICRYCKNNSRETLRNVDAQLYAQIRDNAVSAFFKEFRNMYDYFDIEGLELLNCNPNSDIKFLEKTTL